MNQISLLLTEYYYGEKGGVCYNESHVIRSQAECQIAFENIGYHVKSTWWSGAYTQIPSGCSINDGLKPFFETSTSGLGKGRNDLTPICKGLENPAGIIIHYDLFFRISVLNGSHHIGDNNTNSYFSKNSLQCQHCTWPL